MRLQCHQKKHGSGEGRKKVIGGHRTRIGGSVAGHSTSRLVDSGNNSELFEKSAAFASLQRFGFLVVDEFNSTALCSAIEVLKTANVLCGRPVYSWSIITPDGQPVTSSNGLLPQSTTDYATSGEPQVVFVCGGANIARYVNQQLIALLRQISRDGVVLGGLGSGTFVLAKAGLLDRYRCTIHWESLASLRETHRNIEFLEELFVIDRDRITCAGGIASIDMMLALVRSHLGMTLVAEISDQLILDRVRDSKDRQRVPLVARSGFKHPALARVAGLMETNIESPLSISEIAEASNLSVRHLQRLFHSSLQMTVTEYYKRLRLRHGRELVLQSSLPITEIAVCCGYQSPGQFSKEYRMLFGHTPRRERKQIASSSRGPTLDRRS